MLVNGERALAYIVNVDGVKPIEGADNIELACVGGWKVIINKQQFKPGDEAVFFEIDSLVPEAEWSEFLRPRKFKVKSYKLNKFSVVSQGLLMPMDILPQNKKFKVGDDVTKVLGVKYYVAEDNDRKAKSGNPNEKYNRMAAKHPKLAKKKWFRWLMRRTWGKRLLFVFLGRHIDERKYKFPVWIKKTDEDRIENCLWMLEDKQPFVVTEKIDGTSTTFFLDCTKRKHDFGVCSRNVRQMTPDQVSYHTDKDTGVGNVYCEMALKYNVQDVLERLAKIHRAKRIVLQGETYGESVQGNPLHIKGRDFAAFNLIFDGERLGSLEANKILSWYGIPFVPIIDANFIMPDKDDFEELKRMADGKSVINPRHRREGFVYRSLDGKISAKNVSREYLLKLKD